ncbi:MAG: hypothetical protein M3037_10450, partial [Gemmatimonadota bacterium]|nr:hypothetical protein [Gemmatimonadota bacterium]
GSVTLAPSATAQSQDPQQQGSSGGARMGPRQMIDQKMERLTETLKLDSAQQTTVRSILADETMEMEDLRKTSGGQRAEGGGGGGGRRGGGGGGRRGGGGAPPESTGGAEGNAGSGGPPQKVRAIRDRANKRIEAVLNPEQFTTFRQLFEQERPAGDSASRRGR